MRFLRTVISLETTFLLYIASETEQLKNWTHSLTTSCHLVTKYKVQRLNITTLSFNVTS